MINIDHNTLPIIFVNFSSNFIYDTNGSQWTTFDQDTTRYGLSGSPTQVERIFNPESNGERVMWDGTGAELSESMFDKLKELKFI